MTHPEELLAPYVDGAASPQERATVDAHVSSCARCRAEIAAATAARAELRRLPVVEAPAGLAPDLHPSAPGRARGDAPGWYRWAGAASVAAMIALLLALVLPHLGGGSADSTGAAASGAAPAAPAAASAVPLEIQSQDYAGTALNELIRTQADAPQPSSTDFANATSEGGGEKATTGTTKQSAVAQACITHAFEKVPGHLTRLISATYAGTPAYIGIYEQRPDPSQPVDTVVARVAAAGTCTILTLAQARHTP